jgi:hypothetical protein
MDDHHHQIPLRIYQDMPLAPGDPFSPHRSHDPRRLPSS